MGTGQKCIFIMKGLRRIRGHWRMDWVNIGSWEGAALRYHLYYFRPVRMGCQLKSE
jgi:hypothetical protein